MKNFDDAKEIIGRHKAELCSEYGVTKIGIFGSYARGQQEQGSDLDILVDLERPLGFVKFMKLEKTISALLGVKVDLVTRKALKPYIGERIIQEVRYV